MSIKKVKVISRNPDHYMRETKHDIFKVQRNYDPQLHPFQQAREYKLALNATKLEKVFSKPLVGSLTHSESISSMCCHPDSLSSIFTGTADGELSLWNLREKVCKWKTQAHQGQIFSICADTNGSSFFTVGLDKTIKRWTVNDCIDHQKTEPSDTWLSDTVVTGFSHHYGKNEFLTCGERVLLWDATAKAPKSSFDWNTAGDRHEATVACVRFNPVEKNLFASSDYANNLILYDIRAKEVKKIKMNFRINKIDWNPMEAMVFTAASEDFNCYSFDIRRMDDRNRIIGIHGGHTKAVTDVYYSPTGKEFCTASYDRSIRIFPISQNTSREVYHGRRMYRVHCVLWTSDSKFVVSGSSDHNARIWKANANEKMGLMRDRERLAIDAAEELKRKYANHPEIKRISKYRHLPKAIYNAKNEHKIIRESKMRKEHNVRLHSKAGSVPFVSAKDRPVVGIQDEFPDSD